MSWYRNKCLFLVTALLVCSDVLVLADMRYPLSTNWGVVNNPSGPLRRIQRSSPTRSVFRIIFGTSNDSVLLGFQDTLDGFSTLSIVLNPGNMIFDEYPYQVVWSANRNNPVGVNATLKVSGGNLVLQENNTREVWSTNLREGSVSGINVQDSGNVALYDQNNQTVWQSFDHPTDTLLFGANLTHTKALVASSSATNSSEGAFKMVMEAKSLVFYYSTPGSSAQGQPYWMLGNASVSLLSDAMTPYPSGFVSFTQLFSRVNDSYAYFIVTYSPDGAASGQTYLTRQRPAFLRLESDGRLQWYSFDRTMSFPAYYWYVAPQVVPDDRCSLPTSCGAYGVCSTSSTLQQICNCPSGEAGGMPVSFRARNSSDPTQGCYPTRQWTCDANTASTDFNLLELKTVTYFPNEFMVPLNATIDECKQRCLENCSYAAAFYRYDTTSCYLVHDVLTLRNTSNANYTSFLKVKVDLSGVDANPFGALQLGLVISSGVVVVIVGVAVLLWRRSSNFSSRQAEEEDAFLDSLPGLPPRFSYRELEMATNNFSTVLGEGGFGTVYEGVLLSDGSKIAVKKLGGSNQGQKEFRAEVATIGSINHLQLVRLRGFCSETSHRFEHRLLVYEYMANGSLDRWIFRDLLLDWPVRFQIALDTAQGLCYLHRDCRDKIIHLDVKPQNILLDDHFRAKVADFGMSKLYDREMTEVVTKMRGTPGYMAPEWLLQTGITEKSDIYSYGMVLLEIVSGRKNIIVNADLERWYFPAWAVGRIQGGGNWVEDVLDTQLQQNGNLGVKVYDEVAKVVKIAMWCIQDVPRLRPSMEKVVQMLEGVIVVEDPPLQFDFLRATSGTYSPGFASTLSQSSQFSKSLQSLSLTETT